MKNVIILLLLCLCLPAAAKNTVVVVVPFSPGGTTDTFARKLVETLNTLDNSNRYVVENVSGAGGLISFRRVVNNPEPMLLFTSPAVIIAEVTSGKTPGYSLEKDLVLVSYIGEIPMCLISNRTDDLKKLTTDTMIGHGGIGSTSHLLGVLLSQQYVNPPTLIAYKGGSDATIALMRNEIHYYFHFIDQCRIYHDQKGLTTIAVTGRERDKKYLSNVPTLSEIGIKGFESASGGAYLMANKKMSAESVTRLNDLVFEVKYKNQSFALFADKNGLFVNTSGRDEEIFKQQIEYWRFAVSRTFK